MGYRMLGTLPLTTALVPKTALPTTTKAVVLLQPTLPTAPVRISTYETPTQVEAAPVIQTLYAAKPVPVETATPVIVESSKTLLPVQSPFVYDAATNPKIQDTTSSAAVVYSPTTTKEEAPVPNFSPMLLSNRTSPLATKESDEVEDRNDAAISTLNFRDDSNVKDPFSAKTITGDSDLKQPLPTFVAEDEQINTLDPGAGVDEDGNQIEPDPTYVEPDPDPLVALEEEPVEAGFPWWKVAVGVGVVGAGLGLWFLLGKKRRKNGKRR